MSGFIAALPMYDWPEMRAETDAQWARLRDALRASGIEAPDTLTRRNADMPAVPGGIRDASEAAAAPDPASLSPEELDMHTLWRHPRLLFAQTCWGPMELGLQGWVHVLAQPDYSPYEGGEGPFYSSAIIMRRGAAPARKPSSGGAAELPVQRMRGLRLAYNGADSMSGIIALTRDLATVGEKPDLFSEQLESGGHRASVVAVAQGRADVCAVDCRTWDLVKRFEPEVSKVEVAGWTGRRRGLPYIASRHMAEPVVERLRAVLADTGSVFPAI